MKEISERLGPGIPKQPLMDSCVRAVNLGPGRPATASRRSRDAPVRHSGGGDTETHTHQSRVGVCAAI